MRTGRGPLIEEHGTKASLKRVGAGKGVGQWPGVLIGSQPRDNGTPAAFMRTRPANRATGPSLPHKGIDLRSTRVLESPGITIVQCKRYWCSPGAE
jgi:hypothetical protein